MICSVLTDLFRSVPPIAHVITDSLRCRHGTGKLACCNHCRTTFLNSLGGKKPIMTIRSLASLTATKSFFSQWSSFTASNIGVSLPLMFTVAERTSGNWVEEWLPQMMMFFTASGDTFSREAICPLARLWSMWWIRSIERQGVKSNLT